MKSGLWILCMVVLALALFSPACGAQPGQDQSVTKRPLTKEERKRMDKMCKVVFHVDSDEEGRLLMALENTKNLFKEVPPQQCDVQMVANGKAVLLFRKDRAAKYASEMEALHKQGVLFKACRNAMAKNKVEKSDLSEICEVIPAGILELINLQQEGFAYIKP